MIDPETKGKYLNQQSVEDILREKRERAEERAQMQRRAKFHRWMWALALVAGSFGMIHMVLNGLIDMTIGVCGRGTAL